MSNVENDMLYDMFIDWLDEPIDMYKREEIEVLWNEFSNQYPEGMDSWEYVPGE